VSVMGLEHGESRGKTRSVRESTTAIKERTTAGQ
jgi:hypothetical protein